MRYSGAQRMQLDVAGYRWIQVLPCWRISLWDTPPVSPCIPAVSRCILWYLPVSLKLSISSHVAADPSYPAVSRALSRCIPQHRVNPRSGIQRYPAVSRRRVAGCGVCVVQLCILYLRACVCTTVWLLCCARCMYVGTCWNWSLELLHGVTIEMVRCKRSTEAEGGGYLDPEVAEEKSRRRPTCDMRREASKQLAVAVRVLQAEAVRRRESILYIYIYYNIYRVRVRVLVHCK